MNKGSLFHISWCGFNYVYTKNRRFINEDFGSGEQEREFTFWLGADVETAFDQKE